MSKLSDGLRGLLLRARLESRDFTIVSNNGWGPHVYQRLKAPYRTPFVGLSLAPSCYLRMLAQLRWYLIRPLHFVERSQHDFINEYREKEKLAYPIGSPGDDIEIQFTNYASAKEAEEKWKRRAGRVVKDDARLFVKFCDHDGATPEQLAEFERLPFQHKVCFVGEARPELESAVWIPEAENGRVPNGGELARVSPRYFDTAAWIDGGKPRTSWWRIFRCS